MDGNLPLFRGVPLFLLKFAQTKSVRYESICLYLMFFEWGKGVSSFLWISSFFIETLFSSLAFADHLCDIYKTS